MASFKEPVFQVRLASRNQAKQKALDQLRAKPPVDDAVIAERMAVQAAREAAALEKRMAKIAAKQAADAEKVALALIERPKQKSIEEQKAARDLRYAARKNRK